MLFLVSQSNKRTASVAQVARELNLILKTHSGALSFAENLAAKTRRIACLGIDELDAISVEALAENDSEQPLGVIVCGSRKTLKADAFIPGTMAVIYVLIMLYFKGRGGYKPVSIDEQES